MRIKKILTAVFLMSFAYAVVHCANRENTGPKNPDPDQDKAAVTRVKKQLEIGYGTGESAASVTGDLTLPARGADGVSIAWMSEDPKIINVETPGTGVVTRPDMDTEVTLTATLTKNAATDTKVFDLTVIMSEDADNMQMYPYTCSNGTEAPGMTTAQNTEKCRSCDIGYVLRNEACEQTYPYTCSNGTEAPGMTTAQNTEKCQSCDIGYVLRDEACEQTYPYTCPNGTKAPGMTTAQNAEKCQSCNSGYMLMNERCVTETTPLYPYTCSNGTKAPGMTTAQNAEKCRSCDIGYGLRNEACARTYAYTCNGGEPAIGGMNNQPLSFTLNVERCLSCNPSLVLQPDFTCATVYTYSCPNGTAVSETTLTPGQMKCQSCGSGYMLMNERCERIPTPYTCSNGTKAPGMTTAQNTEKCQSCDMGYVLRDEACEQTYPYRCTGGTAAQGTTTTQNTQKCVSCRTGYSLQPSNMTCVCTTYLTYLCLTNQ